MKVSNNSIYIDAFEQYKKIGLDPLPIPYEDGHPTKGPNDPGWQTTAAMGGYSEDDFTGPCNIGVLLGGEKNLTDIDLDSPEAVAVGGDIMERLMETTGMTMMFGRASKPRSHYVFSCDKSLPTEKVTDPVDNQCAIEYRCVKQDGGRGHQTVFPPSVRYDAGTGQTETICLETDSSLEPVSVGAITLHRRFRMIGAVSLLAKHFPSKSERHNTILALAGCFARTGIKEDNAVQIIRLAYRHSKGYNNDIGKAEADVRSVYKSHNSGSSNHLFGYPKLIQIIPKSVVDKVLELLGIERPEANYGLTDAGNGRRLVDKHKDEIRFCVDDGRWYVWDGVRWRRDVVQRMRELAKDIAADIRNETTVMKSPAPTGDESRDKEATARYEGRKRELSKWANQSENADRVSKTIQSAASDPRITCFLSDFDRDALLLNCPNGIVDLASGVLMPHDRERMMSNLCPTEYDPKAEDKVWIESLDAFTRKHPDVLPFLKRVAGYSLQGNKTEERILILYGPGNAGKGTFMDWLTSALGPDYAIAMDANSVLKQKRDSAAASGDILRLQGKRIVVVSEIEKGSRVQESFMKQASGNDSLVARGLYAAEREFRPTHQFWFQTNYRPGFDSTDSGNKRRYVEIPFDNELSADPLVTFNSKLKVEMRQNPEFLKAVLAWCVQGCIEWQKNGLEIPESVKSATAGLFAHNDFLNEFLTDMCVVDPNEKVTVKELWDAYKDWCEGQGEEPAQGRTFNRMLEERGFERKQARVPGRKNGKAWIGIRIKEHDELVGEMRDAGSQDDIGVASAKVKRYPSQKTFTTVFNGHAKVA